VQVYSSSKELKVTVCVGQPALCACYLNDEGDLLVGLQHQLVRLNAQSYQSMATAAGPTSNQYKHATQDVVNAKRHRCNNYCAHGPLLFCHFPGPEGAQP
jgi:hypothetical protein